MFELTGEYSIILPLMAAIVLATGISNVLSADTIYTLKLRRRGVDLSAPAGVFTGTVSAAMQAVPAAVREDLPLLDAATVLRASVDGVLPVVDEHGAYRGVVTIRAVAEVLSGEDEPAEARSRTVGDATDNADTARVDQQLTEAVAMLDKAGRRRRARARRRGQGARRLVDRPRRAERTATPRPEQSL